MGFAQTEAVQQYLVARFETGMRRGLDGAREVDPGNHRKSADHRRTSADRETVFVIHGRVGDGDDDIAFHQVVEPQFGLADALRAVVLGDQHGTEPRFHVALPG